MKRVGFVLHAGRPEAAEVGARLASMLAARGIEAHTSARDAARIGGGDVVASDPLPPDLDLVFVLGGDGTLLHAAQQVYEAGTPILGVNLGRLGFLSSLERSELETGIDRIVADGFTIEERLVLEGEIVDGGSSRPLWAMNDVVVAKQAIGRAIRIAIALGGEPFIEWVADGLIVSTSTGSTAYSFSAGGPVVSPRLDCLLLTPVSPHGLFDRTVILPPGEDVHIRLLPDPDAASISSDGRDAVPLSSEAELRLRAGERPVRLARVDAAPFWRLVRTKLGLPRAPS